MGAINYGSNDIINLGYNLAHKDYDYDLCEDCYKQVEWALERYCFNYYEVELKGGYYEGFYLDIQFKYLYLEDYNEKLEALKEATRLKKFLEECINDYDMVVYYPGWLTGYEDKKTSLEMVENAIREEKKNIRLLKTDRTLTHEEWKRLVLGK